jgi:hypothetical protein
MNIKNIINEELGKLNIECPLFDLNDEVINYIKKFKSDEDLLNIG